MDPASQQGGDTAAAGVIMRPPFLYLACLILWLVLDHMMPLPLTLPQTALVRWTAGDGLILLGVAIFAAGVRNFFRAATPVPSNQPVRALVTTGIHGWSRNPIYVGMFLLYAGIGLAARSLWVLILTPASRHHLALRCGRARGGLSRAALRRCLPLLQGACAPLVVAIERERRLNWPVLGARRPN